MSELSKSLFVQALPEATKAYWRKQRLIPLEVVDIIKKFAIEDGAVQQFNRDVRTYGVYEACLYATGYAVEEDGSPVTAFSGYRKGLTAALTLFFCPDLKPKDKNWIAQSSQLSIARQELTKKGGAC